LRKPKFRYPEQAPPRPLHLHDLPVGAFVVIVSRAAYGANYALGPSRITEHTPDGIIVEDLVPAGRRVPRWPFRPSAPGYWTAYQGRWYLHSVHETLEAANAAKEVVNGPFKAHSAAEARARAAFQRIRAMALPGHLWNVAAAEKRASELEFLAGQLADCVEALK